MERDRIPLAVGKFQVLQEIGRGGMATVYLARDPDIDRLVAIKMLRDGGGNADMTARFMREARSAGRLDHPNIVTIFQVGEHESESFIAMQYVEGQTLADLVRARVALSVERKLQIIDEVCAGLQFAHRAGIVHRDIKPGNVMVDADGVIKILDFGIARLGGSEMTRAGVVMGTLNYIAPEQLAGKPVDARADVFATGAMVYELLSYTRAFPGEMPEILQQILTDPPRPLEELVPTLDSGLIRVVDRCLAKRPDDRYQTMAELRSDVAAVRRRIVRDEPTTIVLPLAGAMTGGVKPGRREVNRQEVLRMRAEQLERSVDEARRALDSADLAAAERACQQALVLDPEFAPALDLNDQVRAAFEDEHLRAWLTEARTELRRGGLTAASLLVDRALSLNSSSPEAVAIRAEVDEARRTLAELDERARIVEEAVQNARQHLAAGVLDAAQSSVGEALALDPARAESLALASQIRDAAAGSRTVISGDPEVPETAPDELPVRAAAAAPPSARPRVLAAVAVALAIVLGVIAFRFGGSSGGIPPPVTTAEPQRPAATAPPERPTDAGIAPSALPPLVPAALPPSPVTTRPPRDPDPNAIAQEHIESGNRALQAGGDLDAAARDYAEALRLAPGNAAARRGLERVRTLKAAPIAPLLARANRLLEDDGDVDGAIAAVGDALRLDPANAAAKALAKRLQDLKRIENRP